MALSPSAYTSTFRFAPANARIVIFTLFAQVKTRWTITAEPSRTVFTGGAKSSTGLLTPCTSAAVRRRSSVPKGSPGLLRKHYPALTIAVIPGWRSPLNATPPMAARRTAPLILKNSQKRASIVFLWVCSPPLIKSGQHSGAGALPRTPRGQSKGQKLPALRTYHWT